MKTAVVITTINQPTDAVRAWARLYPGDVIVVGDAKTPNGWHCDNTFYRPCLISLHPMGSLEDLIGVNKKAARMIYLNKTCLIGSLEDLIGVNKYQRKMLGYVEAARQDADVIIDTDDDNEPLYGCVEFERPVSRECCTAGWINPHAVYHEPRTWPRGLPLESIKAKIELRKNDVQRAVGVWQGLAQEEPDVDAIFRLTSGRRISFPGYVDDFSLAPGALAPINSQATLWRRECFSLLYLPCTVSMRVCDILRGYVAQPILWAYGYRLGFCGPIVCQERNPHDIMDDFRQELPLYMGMGEAVVAAVRAVVAPNQGIADNLRAAYRAIVGIHGIGDESKTLEEWLNAIGY